jgi:hypothetical protein
MNAKVSRRQDEDETLSNSRLKRLLLSFVLAQASSAIHSSTLFFFKQSSKTFEAFHHVVCVKIFFFSQHHQTRSLSFEYAEDRLRQKEEFKVLSTLSQIFDDEVCSSMRF